MKIEKNHEIERLVSGDPTQTHLTNVHYDVKKKCVVATNGHCLAVVPVTTDEGDVTGWITPEAIRLARRNAKRGEDVDIKANGHLGIAGGATMPRPTTEAGEFPPYEQAIPSYREGDAGTVTVVLDHCYLSDLFKALGGTKRDGIRLTIKLPVTTSGDEVTLTLKEMLDPVVIGVGPKQQPAGRVGVLMPIRS